MFDRNFMYSQTSEKVLPKSFYDFFHRKGYSNSEIDVCIQKTTGKIGADVSEQIKENYEDYFRIFVKEINSVSNAMKLREIYNKGSSFPNWVIHFLKQNNVPTFLNKTEVYYKNDPNNPEKVSTIRKLCTQREPVNMDMRRYYDQKMMQENFGWSVSYYQKYWNENQTLAPNFGVYCQTPVKENLEDPGKIIHIYNAIGAALDVETQPDYIHFIKNNNDKLDGANLLKKELINFYTDVFTGIFACVVDLGLENLVMSGVGANNFAKKYPGGIKAFQEEIWAPTFYKVSREPKFVVRKFFMGFSGSFAQLFLKSKYQLDILDIGYFPAALKSINPQSLEKTLFVNAWDPHSIAGNGNFQDDSLDGHVGRNTAVSVLCWPKTNPYMTYTSFL
jgi:hypothetical protein